MATDQMRYGAVLPGGTATEQLELALLAESAGWDGVFVWEAAYGPDAWCMLAAMAVRTERGPARHHAHAVAVAPTLEGRQPGARRWISCPAAGRSWPSASARPTPTCPIPARSLACGTALTCWTRGSTYPDALGRRHELPRPALRLRDRPARPLPRRKPVQQRIPIWVVGVWPRQVHAARAAVRRHHPAVRVDRPRAGAGRRQCRPRLAQRAWRAGRLRRHRRRRDSGRRRGRGRATVAAWAQAGCSWWLETRWEARDQMRERLAAGPPR